MITQIVLRKCLEGMGKEGEVLSNLRDKRHVFSLSLIYPVFLSLFCLKP